MKTKKLMNLLLITVGFVAMGTSCTSDFTSASDTELATTASDEAQAAALNDEVVNTVDLYVNQTATAGYQAVKAEKVNAVTSPTITVDHPDSTTFPKVITIDFGTTGFINLRNDTLKGKLIITLTDRMWKRDSEKIIQFDSFYVNGKKIDGTKSITYNGLNASLHPNWTIVVSDTITRSDGKTVIWNSTRTREKIASDKFSITGGSAGVNAKGVEYTMLITSPLIVYNNYPHFVQGTVTITSNSRVAVLDYGNGARDNIATVTINGKTKQITLKR